MSERCEGVVLRLTPFSESSYVAVLFTREFGRLDVLAKGARRAKGPMAGQIDLYNLDEFIVLERTRAGLDLLTSASILEECIELRKRPVCFAAACLLGEVVLRSCMVRDAHPKTYLALTEGLRAMDGDGDVASTTAATLVAMLADLGFAPQAECCTRCGQDVARQGGSLSGIDGGVVCLSCLDPSGSGALSVQAVAGLRYLLRVDAPLATRLNLPQVQTKQLLMALVAYTEAVIEAPLRSQDLVWQLLPK